MPSPHMQLCRPSRNRLTPQLPPYTLLSTSAAPQSRPQAPVAAAPDIPGTFLARYFTNQELETHIQALVRRCPRVARSFEIGRSAQGSPILALEISDRPGALEPEPSFRYVLLTSYIGTRFTRLLMAQMPSLHCHCSS